MKEEVPQWMKQPRFSAETAEPKDAKQMKISILSLFPQMFQGPFDYSIIKLAKEKNLVEINYIDIYRLAFDTFSVRSRKVSMERCLRVISIGL